MSKQIRNFLKSFDFFDKPFSFFVGEKKNKSTFIGGFLSISIIILSVSYFYYLIDLYFTNKFEPTITSSISIEDEIISLNVTDSFFIFEFLVNGEPLKQLEKRQGKTYLTYSVTYDTSDPTNGIYTHTEMPLVECQNTKFQGFLCMNSSLITNQNIQMEPIKNIWSQYTLQVEQCNNSTTSNCATQQEIQNLALDSSNFMQFYTKIRQYSSDIRDYKEAYKSEYLLFDSNLVLYTRISLIKASTTVTQGMVIQHSSSSEDVFDFKRIDTYFSKETMEKYNNFNGYATIVFENNQMRNIISIQHAMVTEVLAQFMGIINPLLIVGILARMLAASQIIEDINNILLKEYYKQTALKLVSQREKKRKMAMDQQESDTPQQEMKKIDQSAAIAQLSKKLSQQNFAEESKHYFQMSYFNRAKICLGKLLGGNINLSFRQQGSDSMVYEQIFKQSMKRINIFEVYKDIIKMKMFIKLMLSKEQFAAMQFCGSEIREKQTILPQVQTPIQTKQKKPKNTLNLEKEATLPNIGSSSSQKSNCLFTRNVPSQEIEKINNQKRYSNDAKQVNYPIDNGLNKITQQETNQGDTQAHINRIQQKNDQEADNIQNNLFESDNILDILEKQSNRQEKNDQESAETFQGNALKTGFVREFKSDNSQKLVLCNSESDKDEDWKTSRILMKEQTRLGKNQLSLQKDKINNFMMLQHNGDGVEIELDQNSELQEKQKREDMKEEAQFDVLSFQNQGSPLIKQPVLQNNFRIKSHLYEMDQIEDDKDLQEQLLQTFLKKFKSKLGSDNNKLEGSSNIDKNIFESLLVRDIDQIPSSL